MDPSLASVSELVDKAFPVEAFRRGVSLIPAQHRRIEDIEDEAFRAVSRPKPYVSEDEISCAIDIQGEFLCDRLKRAGIQWAERLVDADVERFRRAVIELATLVEKMPDKEFRSLMAERSLRRYGSDLENQRQAIFKRRNRPVDDDGEQNP